MGLGTEHAGPVLARGSEEDHERGDQHCRQEPQDGDPNRQRQPCEATPRPLHPHQQRSGSVELEGKEAEPAEEGGHTRLGQGNYQDRAERGEEGSGDRGERTHDRRPPPLTLAAWVDASRRVVLAGVRRG